jgi:acetyltransferase
LINSQNGLCTSFAPGLQIEPGGIGFITQSGAFGGSFLMQLADQPQVLGFSKFAHVGNMSDVSNVELLAYLGQDPQTRVIGIYMEGVTDGRKLLDTARQVTRHKPVFVLKVGSTTAGSQAAQSHTGTLAGSDRVYDAAFKQSGMVRVATMEALVDACKAASLLPLPTGNRVCILTEAGGPGIIAMDEIGSQAQLALAALQAGTIAQLKRILPDMAVVSKTDGYIDMTAAAMEAEHAGALKLILQDPGVDQVLGITVPPTFLPAIDVAESIVEVVREYHHFVSTQQRCKPVAFCLMRGEAMQSARKLLEENSIPTFDTPDRAARALIHLNQARRALKTHEIQL